jgi:L-seryl-tRNA(Ser) seleniumtransferase
MGPEKIAITAGEVGRLLLAGEPRIMSHAESEGYSFVIRPVTMKPEHHKVVAQRLYDVFRDAPKAGAVSSTARPASVEGDWQVDVDFVAGSSRHKLVLKADGTRVKGIHYGRSLQGALRGTVDGSRVRLTSSLPFEGMHLSYAFTGTVSGDRMSGELDLGEYGRAQWKARKAG